MKKLTLLLATLLASMSLFLVSCGMSSSESESEKTSSSKESIGSELESADPSSEEVDIVAPVITVPEFDTEYMVGAEVTLPAATAEDDVDGDVSAKIKVTVSQMKADGETVNRDMIYEKPANVEQTFSITSNTLLIYKVRYFVKDKAGNLAEVIFTITAIPDNEGGDLTINVESVEGFDLAGIVGKAGVDVKLPSATAIDQPGDVDISDRVEARLYEKVDGEYSSTVFAKVSDFTEVKTVRIPAGEYLLVYSVRDEAGNDFEDVYEIPVVIAEPDEVNMAYDKNNFAFDNDEGFEETGKLGMSWINEYGELSFGNTSAEPMLDQTVGFTSALTKIHEQYVGVVFNADLPTTNGQAFYTVSARGSKNRTTMPNKETCTWPDYLFLRIGPNRIESRVERMSDKEMTTIKGYDGKLLDGKDHMMFFQWKNVGEAPDEAGAAIRLYGWVDKTPGGEANADFIFEVKVGETIAQGTLPLEIFTELWNESTGAGWFTMDTYSGSKPHDDDHMRIKGLVIYDAEETEFSADIIPPVVSVDFTVADVYATNEAIVIPQATVEGASDVKCFIIDSEGVKTEFGDTEFVPTKAGKYRISYEALDDAGNIGYAFFDILVADRDDVAPELTLSSEDTITVQVGDEVVLPTASAMDNQDGDISADVKVEIIGTEHVTDRTPGGKYYPMTAGTQRVIYTSTDSYNNVATKEITIVVESKSAGNVLTGELFTSQGGVGLATSEYLYDQKVSMIMNIEKQQSVIQFNTRGPVKNNDWPNGLIIRITELGQIEVSAAWHDHCIYGSTSYSKQNYWLGCDILFEFQHKNVVIDGVEYVRTQIWVQGELLEFSASAEKGGYVGLEDGVSALYRKVSDFIGEQAENIYSGPFWLATNLATVTISELRIDGTSCEKPADPVVPVDPVIINEYASGKTLAANNDLVEKVVENLDDNIVALTIAPSSDSGVVVANILGTPSNCWTGGVSIRFDRSATNGDGVYVRYGNVNDGEAVAQLAIFNLSEGYTFAYRVTENDTHYIIDMWGMDSTGTVVKVAPHSIGASFTSVVSFDEDSKSFMVLKSAIPGLTSDCSILTPGALNNSCAWTVTAQLLDKEPVVAGEGYPNPTNGEDAEVLLTAELNCPATTDTIAKVVDNLNENYVAINLKHNENPSYYAMGINLLGSTSNGWTAGLVLAMTQDGHYFRLGGVNNANLVQLNFYSMGNGAEMTIAYQIKYIEEAGMVTKIRIAIWQGAVGGALNVVAPHGEVTGGEGWAWNADLGAFEFDYNLFADATQIAPDCTLIAMQAFNDKDVDCNWTVSSVTVSPTVPRPAPTVDSSLASGFTVPQGFDGSARAITNLYDQYVKVEFDISKNDESADLAFGFGVNIFGDTTSAWLGGIMLAFRTDGLYVKHSNVNGENLAQTNVYSLSGIDTFVYRIYDVNVDGVDCKAIEMWAGTDGNLTRVGCHAAFSEAISYNEELGAFVISVEVMTSAGFSTTPDCSLMHPSALNGNSSITFKVSVSNDAPVED